jgi:phage-related protein
MAEKFRVEFLPEAREFIERLDRKTKGKILYNIRKAQFTNDPELFKKLTNTIWEFRTLFNKSYYRVFAFWDNADGFGTVVLATHGLIKKTGKTPSADLESAERIRLQYFKQKK